jgi:hypothetical protein
VSASNIPDEPVSAAPALPVAPPVVPHLTESERAAVDAELDGSIAMRGTPSGGALSFEDLVMQRLRATPDVLKATLLLAREPKTFRALTVAASPRWNRLLTLAGFPSAPAPAVSLAALRLTLKTFALTGPT